MQTYGPVHLHRRSPAEFAVRVVACLAVTAAGACAGFFTAFVAAIEYSGCFIGCSGEPNRPAGVALSVLAGALLAAGPLLTAKLFRSAIWYGLAVAVGMTGTLVSLAWASSS